MNKPIKNYSEDTLKIRNISVEISDRDKEKLLRHFGACGFKFVESKMRRSCTVYAKFQTAERARNALMRLHQADVFGARLYVEYAKQEVAPGSFFEISGPSAKTGQSQQSTSAQQLYDEFYERLNAWNQSVNFCQPPPPHLKYNYPKANVVTINNIAHALAGVPKFYNQVLHLMNRMNLPPPFAKIPEQLSMPSNIESICGDSEEERISMSVSKRQLPRSDPEALRKKLKVHHHHPHAHPQPHHQTTHISHSNHNRIDTSEVFDVVSLNKPKFSFKIDEKLSDDPNRPSTPINNDTDCSFGLVDGVQTQEDSKQHHKNHKISDEELKTNRISSKDWNLLPVFKDYHAGAPTNRLYIKNLSKSVEEKDLQYIFNRYDTLNRKHYQIDIKLMREGRMKGQAFVTFPNPELCSRALKETNGYILKKKPMVVVFAKSSSS